MLIKLFLDVSQFDFLLRMAIAWFSDQCTTSFKFLTMSKIKGKDFSFPFALFI